MATILIVDDNANIRESLRDFLEDRDHRVVTAENGRVGLEIFERDLPDAALVDLRMPEVDGLEVLRTAGKMSPDTPLIVISGTGVMQDAVEALHCGACDYILKPIEDMSVVTHALSRALDTARLKKENRAYREKLESLVKRRTGQLKQTSTQLKESEERFKTLVDRLPETIFEIDMNNNLTFVNQRAYDMFGYSPADDFIQGMNSFQMISEEDRSQARDKLARRMRGENLGAIEYQGLRKDGSTFPILLHINPILDGDKQTGFRGIIVDMTAAAQAEEERRSLHAQLEQTQKLESIGRLAGGVAHDFNNMLGAILGYTELAIDKVDPSEQTHSYLESVIQATKSSIKLTRQLLAFARKETIVPEILDLNTTVGSMLDMLKRLIGEEISLDWRPAERLWPIKMDPGQIDQIMANLCVNAKDAIAGIGNIVITSGNSTLNKEDCKGCADSSPGDYVLLSITDNGCGMTREVLDHLFEPFFTTKTPGKGTGLGLATVYGAVGQNNGFIAVDSQPGKGTVFNIYLPRHRPQNGDTVPRKDEQAEGPVVGGSETLLLVEDEPLVLKSTSERLSELGYDVLAAETPGKAMEIAGEHPGKIHFLLTDVVLPEMNGRVLAEHITELYPNIKKLFVSGYMNNVFGEQAGLDKKINYLQKPVPRRVLAKKIREILDGDE